ncbi:MAG TPA: T9SS type A sorting domain-containing protein [Bacteroidia bacterium]|nr:T9SS type A sorting domain-containing protein [Bacteroidia bacterium]
MKRLYTTIFLTLVAISLQAQNATPNAGFENWNQVGNRFDPADWNNLNPSTGIIGVLTCARASGADAHSGSYAIKLTTKLIPGFNVIANGIASTGTLITTPPYGVSGGIAFTGRPDSITGWYKYTPAGTDQGFVELQLLGTTNTDTIGYVRFGTPNATVSTYTRFAAAVNYLSTATPSNTIWILSSSKGVGPIVNSQIFIDDIAMVFNPSSVNTIDTKNEVSILGNVIKEKIRFNYKNTGVYQFKLIDTAGRIVTDTELNSQQSTVDVSALDGLYFYIIENNSGIINNGKVIIRN